MIDHAIVADHRPDAGQVEADLFALSGQQALVFARQPSDRPAVAGILLELPPGTDPRGLENVVLGLCREHEVLRTRYVTVPGLRLPVQSIGADPACAFRSVGSDASVGALLAEAAARPLHRPRRP